MISQLRKKIVDVLRYQAIRDEVGVIDYYVSITQTSLKSMLKVLITQNGRSSILNPYIIEVIRKVIYWYVVVQPVFCKNLLS